MPNYDEQKISLTLSCEAYNIIESDMSIFFTDKWAGFVNKVISNYKEDSSASIKLAVQKRADEFRSLLAELPPDEQKEIIMKTYERKIEQQLRIEMNSFDTDSRITKKIRIKNEIYEDINFVGESIYYSKEDYRYAGLYIKALIEDYARQPFVMRESIFFKDKIDAFEKGINEKKIVKIEYCSRNREKSTLRLKPYGIFTDPMNNYHYCVGVLYCPNNKSSIDIYTLRLSRITDAHCMTQGGHITGKEKESIETQIKEKGIQYLQGSTSTCKIELSEKGQKRYQSVLHLRPKYSRKTQTDHNTAIYEFDCTEEQIRNYFFQFGADAVIKSPSSLRDEFAERYKEAVLSYD